MRPILLVTLATLLVVAAACEPEEALDDPETDPAEEIDEPEEEPDEPGEDADAEAEANIRVGNFYAADTTYAQAFDSFAENVKAESNGEIEVEVFHAELGDEADHIEGVAEGSIEMMTTGTAGIGLFVPETAVFELWFLYDEMEVLVEAFESLQEDLDERYQEDGFRLLGAYYDGPRSMLTNEEIRTLDDVEGIDFRVPPSELYIRMAEALGANAQSIPFDDVYTSLETGVIDAMEGTPTAVVDEGFYEVADYYALNMHTFQPLSIVYNAEAWDELSDEHQQIVRDAVERSSEEHLRLWQEETERSYETMEEAGVEILDVEDREDWEDAVTEEREAFAEEQGELGQLILEAIDEAGE